jgi:hypothetical protein
LRAYPRLRTRSNSGRNLSHLVLVISVSRGSPRGNRAHLGIGQRGEQGLAARGGVSRQQGADVRGRPHRVGALHAIDDPRVGALN